MSYICVKKLKLNGKECCPGDTIPDSAFAEGRAGKLKAYGYVAEVDENAVPTVPVMMAEEGVLLGDVPQTGPLVDTIPLVLADQQFADSIPVVLDKPEEGQTPVGYAVSGEELQSIVDIMQKNANDAVAAIAEEIDETVLTFIAKVDSRKTVVQAAQKQLAVIEKLNGGSEEPVAEEESGAAEQ